MRKLTLILILFLAIPLKINADELNIILDCPQKAKPKANISCTIKETSTTPLNGIKMNTTLDSGLTYKKITAKNNWQIHYNENNGFTITKSNNKETSNEVATLNLTTPELSLTNNKYKVTLYNIEVSDTNYKALSHEEVSSEITILSDDNTLADLSVNNATISPKFNKNTIKYQATTTKDNITITAIPSNKDAKISGDIGNKKLNYGSNIFKINVTSPLGNDKTYTITVIRKLPTTTTSNKKTVTANKSNDASLKGITIQGHYLSFESTKYNYEITVPNKEDTINITATTMSDKAKLSIDKIDNLNIGDNIITLTVTAEDGTICKYTINVNRKALSNNTSIKQITIDNYKLNIKDNIYDYTLKIKQENKLNIKVILNDKSSTYKIIGNKDLKDGSIITITVTAEDNTNKDYTITIKKAPISNNSIFDNTKLIIIISALLIITASITLIKKRILK